MHAIAKRLLAHDDAEAIVAGLVGSFLGAHGTEAEVQEQAAAARRARPARPADDLRDAPEGAATRASEARAPRDEDDGNGRRRRRRDRPEGAERSEGEPRRAERSEPHRAVAEPRAAVEPAPVVAEVPEAAVARGPTVATPAPMLANEARHEDGDDGVYSNVFLNIGRRDGVRVGDILRLFEQRTGLGKDALGRIRIRDRHSFVAVPTERVEEALAKLAGARFDERDLIAEIARAERGPSEPTEA
jgi:ATP-dependent RNA helicase DeaD